eukprot:gene14316-biopygen2763
MVHEPVAATSLSRHGEAFVPQARSGSGHRLSGLARGSVHWLAPANPAVVTNRLRIGYGSGGGCQLKRTERGSWPSAPSGSGHRHSFVVEKVAEADAVKPLCLERAPVADIAILDWSEKVGTCSHLQMAWDGWLGGEADQGEGEESWRAAKAEGGSGNGDDQAAGRRMRTRTGCSSYHICICEYSGSY